MSRWCSPPPSSTRSRAQLPRTNNPSVPISSRGIIPVVNAFTGKTALVTGASSGMGEQFARQLAQRGVAHLVLTSLPDDRLESLKTELLRLHPQLKIETYPGDLAKAREVTALIAQLEKNRFSPDILINNAGFGDLGPFSTGKPKRLEGMLTLNVIALTRLSRWAVTGMVERKSGWICHLGSTAGLIPAPTSAVYGATKAYVNSFSEALRVELRGTGVKVLTLCPGPVDTGFLEASARKKKVWTFQPPAYFYVDKVNVVRQALDALERGQSRLIPGLLIRLPMLAMECAPRWFLRFLSNLFSPRFREKNDVPVA